MSPETRWVPCAAHKLQVDAERMFAEILIDANIGSEQTRYSQVHAHNHTQEREGMQHTHNRQTEEQTGRQTNRSTHARTLVTVVSRITFVHGQHTPAAHVHVHLRIAA